MKALSKPAWPGRALALMVFLLGAAGAGAAQTRGTEAIKSLEFSAGKRMATVSGTVQLPHGEGDMHNDGADRYAFHYRAGQRLVFNLKSDGNRALFSISRMDGAPAPNLPATKRNWTGRLPQTGDYYVTVWTGEGAADYTLKVSRH